MSQRFVHGYLGYLLGQANHAVYKDFDLRVRKAGLSGIEWRVLASVHDGPALPVSELAADILSKQPTVTKLVQRMASLGTVELLADVQDQRRTLVQITPTGQKLVKPLIQAAKTHEASVLTALDATDTIALKELLCRLVALSVQSARTRRAID